jgi:hypothetical protein
MKKKVNNLNQQLQILLEMLKHFLYTEGRCVCKLCKKERQSVYEEEK